MLQETGTIVKIDPGALWVETVQKSVCGSCVAQKGCGHHTLVKALSNSSIIRILLNGRSVDEFHINQSVTIAIPEGVVVKGSLLLYFTPLFFLMLFATLGYELSGSDGLSAVLSFIGLVVGGFVVRWHSVHTRNDPRQQPLLLDTPC